MAKTKQKPVESRRDTPEYAEGVAAFAESVAEDDCPHPIGEPKRAGWYRGWFDSRVQRNIGPALKKWGLAFP